MEHVTAVSHADLVGVVYLLQADHAVLFCCYPLFLGCFCQLVDGALLIGRSTH